MNEPFDITAPTLTLRNLKAAVQACADAYSDPPSISDAATGTHLTIKEFAERIEIAFRGTVDEAGWKIDGRAWCSPFLIGQSVYRVHAGFCDSFAAVLPKLKAALTDLPAKPLVIVGHSKGSAEALLAAIRLRNGGWKVHSVWGAGTPRVGDKVFAKYCDELFPNNHWRVVDEADIVCKIPSWFCGFRHSGHQIFLSNGGYALDPANVMQCLSDELELWKARRKGAAAFAQFADDHHMQNYLTRVSGLL